MHVSLYRTFTFVSLVEISSILFTAFILNFAYRGFNREINRILSTLNLTVTSVGSQL